MSMFQERSFEKQGTKSWDFAEAGNVQWLVAFHLVMFLGLFFWRAHVLAADGGIPVARVMGVAKEPIRGQFQVWRLFTYMWFHNNLFLLVANMAGLWIFAPALERRWGLSTFLQYYIAAGCFTGLCAFLFSQPIAHIGATGAVISVLMAYFFLYPERELFSIIQAKYGIWIGMGILVIVHYLSSLPGERALTDPNAAVAQLGGVIFGWLYFTGRPWIKRLYERWKRIQQKKMKRKQARMRVRVEKLLQKISEEGFDQLSWKEKGFLRKASRVYQKADEARDNPFPNQEEDA